MKKAIIDIDGVLNTYPKTQIDYFNFMLDKNYKSLDEIKNNLSYNEYKYLKNQYRQSAFKHNCKASPGARKLLKYLRDNNYLIYIITARELFKYNIIYDGESQFSTQSIREIAAKNKKDTNLLTSNY